MDTEAWSGKSACVDWDICSMNQAKSPAYPAKRLCLAQRGGIQTDSFLHQKSKSPGNLTQGWSSILSSAYWEHAYKDAQSCLGVRIPPSPVLVTFYCFDKTSITNWFSRRGYNGGYNFRGLESIMIMTGSLEANRQTWLWSSSWKLISW